MAKRAAPDEQPYRPLLDVGLMNAVLGQPEAEEVELPPPVVSSAPSRKVLEIVRQEPAKWQEPVRAEPVFSTPSDSERLRQEAQALVEKFDQEKRILFTRGETQAIDRLVTSLATRLGCQVKVSHVMRALVSLLLHAEGEIDRRAGENGPMVRPPNGDAQALQRFEKEIARIVGAAIRDAGPLR